LVAQKGHAAAAKEIFRMHNQANITAIMERECLVEQWQACFGIQQFLG